MHTLQTGDVYKRQAQGETSIVFEEVDFAYNEEVNLKLQSDYFTVDIDEETGGIFKLSNPGDEYGTNYVMNPTIKPEFDVDDSRWTGDVKLTVKKGDSDYYPALTSWSCLLYTSSNCFKKRMGISPQNYRKKYEEHI